MRLFYFLPFLAIWVTTPESMAQSLDSSKVYEAIEWHYQGRYSEALNRYNSLLLEFPESALLHCEKSLTCAAMNDYPCCIASGNRVLQNKKGEYHTQAYLSVSSCLDYSGEAQESIKLLKKALRKKGENYLFYFNLGVTYFRMEEIDKSIDYLQKGVMVNSAHPSGHLLLGLQERQKNNQVKAFMALQYFLLLEPSGPRAKQGAEALWALFQENAPIQTKKEDERKSNTIGLGETLFHDNAFPKVGPYLSVFFLFSRAYEKEQMSSEEQFVKLSKALYSYLLEKPSKNRKDPWHSLYLPIFTQMDKAGHTETFCYYILQSINKNAASWLSRNSEKLEAFSLWAGAL